MCVDEGVGVLVWSRCVNSVNMGLHVCVRMCGSRCVVVRIDVCWVGVWICGVWGVDVE